jgi:hypothetical protein
VGRNFAWTSTSGSRIPPDALAAGETATKEKLYVGRVVHDGTLTIGKVRRLSRDHRVDHRKYICTYRLYVHRPSSVAVVMSYSLDNRGSIPARRKRFFSTPQHPDRPWGPPSLLFIGTGGTFPRGKAAGS